CCDNMTPHTSPQVNEYPNTIQQVLSVALARLKLKSPDESVPYAHRSLESSKVLLNVKDICHITMLETNQMMSDLEDFDHVFEQENRPIAHDQASSTVFWNSISKLLISSIEISGSVTQ
ncbi:hypothetical protein L9F63_021937, partial [Diploptera punctata]